METGLLICTFFWHQGFRSVKCHIRNTSGWEPLSSPILLMYISANMWFDVNIRSLHENPLSSLTPVRSSRVHLSTFQTNNDSHPSCTKQSHTNHPFLPHPCLRSYQPLLNHTQLDGHPPARSCGPSRASPARFPKWVSEISAGSFSWMELLVIGIIRASR